MSKSRNAFSLMELMIVIVILGLLAGLVMPKLLGSADKAKQNLVCVAMNNIKQTLNVFKLDNGSYPSQEQGLKALISNPDAEMYPNYEEDGYFETGVLPKDPWKHHYIYVMNDDGFDLISLGANGKEGGTKENRDITYDQCKKK